MELGLKDKVAIITGASRGIGQAIAQTLAAEGMKLVLAARGQEALDATASALRKTGAAVEVVVGDVTQTDIAQALVAKATQTYGRLDVLVNNVGGSRGSGPLGTATDAQWLDVLNLNFLSTVRCSTAAVAWMKDHGGGVIVHMSSIYGREYATSGPYSAAKAAVIALAKEMAVDLAPHRIRVNSVAPGSIFFPGGSWERRQKADPQGIAQMVDKELPWKRFGAPEEVAALVAFLCSERASWISGACIPVDGAQGRAF